ncbi:MAG: DUF4350 domain-containing protein [Candidatus Brocadiae bacterium]|nr:DUF4350 domain-containing protein [Candidatus Brocadiia bacterium]
MKAAHERGWVGIAALGVAALAVAWTAAWALSRGEKRRVEDRGSSFGGDAGGTRGLMLMLASEGVRVAPQTRAVTALQEAGVVLVIGGEGALDEAELDGLVDWVAGGGHVVAAVDRSCRLTERFGIEVKGREFRRVRAMALEGEPLALETWSGVSLESEESTDLYGGADGFLVSEIEWGDGWITFVADTWCATNEGIDAGDNILVWIQLVTRHLPGKPVWFLETIHGHLREPGVSEYLVDAGWAPAALHVAFLALIGLWYFGVRPAPVLGVSSLVRRPAAEHAATMAHLYRRGRAERHAVGVLLEHLKTDMARPPWERGLARLEPPERAAAAKEAAALAEEGRLLGLRTRPAEESIRQWASRVARLRGRIHERSDE